MYLFKPDYTDGICHVTTFVNVLFHRIVFGSE